MKLWSFGLLALCLTALLGLSLGVLCFSPLETMKALCGVGTADVEAVVREIRLPRVIMAAHAGAVLALGGLAFQTVLRNPLAEPYMLGVSGGAAVGAVLGVLLGWGSTLPPALAGGLSVLGLAMYLGARHNTTGLLLSGVMINAFCGAVILLLLSLASPPDMSAIMFWFMGNLGACTPGEAMLSTLLFVPGYVLSLRLSHVMNLLHLGEDTAHSLGVHVRRTTLWLVGGTSLMVSGLVAAVGPLGFVGLVVPQLLRLVLGNDHRRLVPGCLLLGAAFMVLCDTASRLLPLQTELPSGVLTALVGAPVFILLLRRASS